MKVKKVVKLLKAAGFTCPGRDGQNHLIFLHPTDPKRNTAVPDHPKSGHIRKGTLGAISRQSGVQFR
jgi:predicted RNA binding protein YcfA (HicA-like mRNA interferase family)